MSQGHGPERAPTEKQAWVALLLAAVVFVGSGFVARLLFPQAGMQLEPPWYHSSTALFEAAGKLGDAGRDQQRIVVLTLDTIIPLTYGWAYFRALWCYGGRFGGPGLRWLGVAAMLCDFAENACIVTVLSVFPERPAAVAVALQAFAWTKWGILALATLGILGAWASLRLRNRRSAPAALGG